MTKSFCGHQKESLRERGTGSRSFSRWLEQREERGVSLGWQGVHILVPPKSGARLPDSTSDHRIPPCFLLPLTKMLSDDICGNGDGGGRNSLKFTPPPLMRGLGAHRTVQGQSSPGNVEDRDGSGDQGPGRYHSYKPPAQAQVVFYQSLGTGSHN